MKRFVFVSLAALLWTAPAPAQLAVTGVGGGGFEGTSGGGGGGCAEATAFLARNGNANPTATTTLICGMVTDGTWARMDAFYILATDTAAHANLNAVSSSFTLTAIGAPTLTFTANVGYTTSISSGGNGLNTGFNTNTSGTNYTLNNSGMGICIQTNDTTSSNAVFDMGVADGTQNADLASNWQGFQIFHMNDSTLGFANTTVSSLGLWSVSRLSSSAVAMYKNASSTAFATDAGASTAKPNFNVYIGLRNVSGGIDSPGARQYSFAWIGGGLTGAQHVLVQARTSAYMTAVGGSGC